MADAVSELYAKIGFKVDNNSLRSVKKAIEGLSKQMSSFNKVADSTVKSYSKLSKRIVRDTKDQENVFKELSKSFRRVRQIMNAGAWAVGGVAKQANVSLSGAIARRDFGRYSGVSLNRLQDIEERFARIGSAMTQGKIMSDMTRVMENITNIGFGMGKLFGFKVSGINAAAYQKDVGGLIDALVPALAGVDNQKRVKILNDLGFSGQDWFTFFDEQIKSIDIERIPRLSEEEQKRLEESAKLFKTLNLAIGRTRDKFMAALLPSTDHITQAFNDFVNRIFESGKMDKLNEWVSDKFDSLGQKLEGLDVTDFDNVINKISAFGGFISDISYALGTTIGVMAKVYKYIVSKGGSFLGNVIGGIVPDRTPEEARANAQRYINNILEYGAKDFAGLREGDPMSEVMAGGIFGRSISDAKKFYENYQRMQSGAPTVIINNNQRVTTNVETTNDEIGSLIEDATAQGVAAGNGQIGWGRDAFVFAGVRGD